MIDEPFSLQPGKKPVPPKVRIWLIACAFGAFLTLNLATVGAFLAWFYVTQVPAKIATVASTPPSIAKSEPAPPIPDSKPPMKPAPSPSPPPKQDLASNDNPAPPARPSPKNNEPPPQAVLEAQGLVRSDYGFVLRDEARCFDLLEKTKQTRKQGEEVAGIIYKVNEYDQMVAGCRHDLDNAILAVKIAENNLGGLRQPMNNVELDFVNGLKAELAFLRNCRDIADRQYKLILEQGPSLADRREATQRKERLEADYKKDIAELRKLFDSINARYANLARDESVTAAVRRVGASGTSPSRRFIETIEKGLTEGEDLIRR